ncbi:hypothetical protein BD779DRAFT_1519566, partial [Infundibulicybe gibba]
MGWPSASTSGPSGAEAGEVGDMLGGRFGGGMGAPGRGLGLGRDDAISRIGEAERRASVGNVQNVFERNDEEEDEVVMPTRSNGTSDGNERDAGGDKGREGGRWAVNGDEDSLSLLTTKACSDGLSGTTAWNFDMIGGGYPRPAAVSGGFNIDREGGDGEGQSAASTSAALTSRRSDAGSRKLRVRRSTFVPGWAVPPRVLLVDDDAVSRKLSSKFLQVFGCMTDVAVDGLGAVTKMNLEKYDLVLMDIVMPKLDGVSATSMIRKFDHMTPIISMTSNSKPNEIMTYYSSGMNDILPKPFTKEGLLDMLEKHLMHLKVIQQMTRVPRSIGVPSSAFIRPGPHLPGCARSLQRWHFFLKFKRPTPGMQGGGNINFGLSLGSGMGDGDGRINPLAGMGLTDEQYSVILENIVKGETFVGGMGNGEKRPLDETGDGREGKRSRFEVIE